MEGPKAFGRNFIHEGLLPLALFAFLTNLGWGMVIPLFPLILESVGGGIFEFTFSFFLFNFASAALRYPLGYLADVWGRHLFLTACSCTCVLASAVAIFYERSFLLAAFTLFGVSTAFYFQTLYALVVDIVPKDEIGRSYGNMHIAEGIGYLTGPLLAGFLLEVRPHLIFALTLLIFAACIPLTLRVSKNAGGSMKGIEKLTASNFFRALRTVWALGVLLFIAELLRGFSVGFLSPSLPIYLENFNAEPALVGAITMIAMACMYAAQAAGALIDKLGSMKIFLISSVIAAPLLVAISLAASLTQAAALVFAYHFMSGLSWLAFSSMLGYYAIDEQRALFLGSAWSMWRFGYAFGSLSCHFVWESFGIRSLFPTAAIFTFASIFAVIASKGRLKRSVELASSI